MTFATSVMVDRWQLSAGPKFSVTPWHRAPYVFMRFRCMFHLVLHVFYLDVAYVALAIHVCCKRMFHFFKRTLQVFYLYFLHVAMAIHVCCNCMFQIFHPV